MSDVQDYSKKFLANEPIKVGYVVTLLVIFALGIFGVIPLVLKLCTIAD